MSSWSGVKHVSFHVPSDRTDAFFQWEDNIVARIPFDTGAGGFGSSQMMLRDWQLDFITPTQRRGVINWLKREIERHRWTAVVLGNTAEIYLARRI